jgi:hypothetical protein
MTTTINERQADVEASFDQDPVELGDQASVTADGASAVGVGAEAFAQDSFALGDSTTIQSRTGVASFGLRDLLFFDGYGLTFPEDQGSQNAVDIPVTDNAAQGEEHSITFSVAGTEVFEMYAEADGNGGVQNLDVNVPDSLSVSNDITTTSLTGESVTIEDDTGTTVAVLDASKTPAALQLVGNNIDALNKIIAQNSELLLDGDLTLSGSVTEGATL